MEIRMLRDGQEVSGDVSLSRFDGSYDMQAGTMLVFRQGEEVVLVMDQRVAWQGFRQGYTECALLDFTAGLRWTAENPQREYWVSRAVLARVLCPLVLMPVVPAET